MHTCVHVHVSALCMCACMCACVCVCMCACLHMSVHVSACVCVHVQATCIASSAVYSHLPQHFCFRTTPAMLMVLIFVTLVSNIYLTHCSSFTMMFSLAPPENLAFTQSALILAFFFFLESSFPLGFGRIFLFLASCSFQW